MAHKCSRLRYSSWFLLLSLSLISLNCEDPFVLSIPNPLCQQDSDCPAQKRCVDKLCKDIDSEPHTPDATPPEPSTPEPPCLDCQDTPPEPSQEPNCPDCPQEQPPTDVPECTSTTDCSGGDICIKGKCGRCQQDSDCPVQGAFCNNGTCISAACKVSSECLGGLVCRNFTCEHCNENNECPQDHYCQGKTLCKKSECKADSDCQGGKICKDDQCITCQNDQDCKTPGFMCIKSMCTPGVLEENGALRWTQHTSKFAQSCKQYLTPPAGLAPALKDGVYWIKPNAEAEFKTYCLMTQHGGGWTLLLKADGRKETFGYDSSHWSSPSPFQPDQLALDEQETKLKSYTTLPFSELLLGFRTPPAATGTTRYIVLSKANSSSLHSLIAPGNYIAFDKALGRSVWKSTIPNSSLQDRCNQEGFNSAGSSSVFAHARIGIISNDGRSCRDTDSRIGFGGKGESCGMDKKISVGNAASYCSSDNKKQNIPSFGFVFAR